MRQFLFSLICLLSLVGCNKPHNSSSAMSNGLPCDTAWAVSKGESKQAVYDFMKSQDLDVTVEDSTLVGFKFEGIYWCGEKWDMATIRFNANDKAIGISLMRGEPFDEYTVKDVVDFLKTRYGAVEHDPELTTWNFRGNENTSAFIMQYPRTMIDVTWNISN